MPKYKIIIAWYLYIGFIHAVKSLNYFEQAELEKLFIGVKGAMEN